VPELQRCVLHTQHGAVFASLGCTRRVPLLDDGSDADLWPAAAAASRPAVAGVTKDGVFYPRTRARVELLPEEALYLVERGSLECRRRVHAYRGTAHDADEAWVGMSVQQAWAELSTSDGLTRERYQVRAASRHGAAPGATADARARRCMRTSSGSAIQCSARRRTRSCTAPPSPHGRARAARPRASSRTRGGRCAS
jgi:hypothetical protein